MEELHAAGSGGLGGGNGVAGGEEDEDVRLDRGLVTWIVPLGGKDADCQGGHADAEITVGGVDGGAARGFEYGTGGESALQCGLQTGIIV
jgi:hypothetical protein